MCRNRKLRFELNRQPWLIATACICASVWRWRSSFMRRTRRVIDSNILLGFRKKKTKNITIRSCIIDDSEVLVHVYVISRNRIEIERKRDSHLDADEIKTRWKFIRCTSEFVVCMLRDSEFDRFQLLFNVRFRFECSVTRLRVDKVM